MGNEEHDRQSWEIYSSRVEPAILSPIGRNAAGPCYVNLRETGDLMLLKDVLKLLREGSREKEKDLVILPWISSPYGTVRGYGVYDRKKAEHLRERARQEGWGSPRPGPIYSQEVLEAWIGSIGRTTSTEGGIESRV